MLMMLLVVMATPIASDQSHSSLHRRRRNNDVINDGGKCIDCTVHASALSAYKLVVNFKKQCKA